MNLRVECTTQDRAIRIAHDILDKVRNGEFDTWSFAHVSVDEQRQHLPCIYHDTAQTQDEDKIAYFHVYQLGTQVVFDMYPRRDSNLTRDVKLWLLGRLAEMVISHYIEHIVSIHFNTL